MIGIFGSQSALKNCLTLRAFRFLLPATGAAMIFAFPTNRYVLLVARKGERKAEAATIYRHLKKQKNTVTSVIGRFIVTSPDKMGVVGGIV